MIWANLCSTRFMSKLENYEELTKETRARKFLKQKCCKSKLMSNMICVLYSWLSLRENSAVVLCFHNTYVVQHLNSCHVVLSSEA